MNVILTHAIAVVVGLYVGYYSSLNSHVRGLHKRIAHEISKGIKEQSEK